MSFTGLMLKSLALDLVPVSISSPECMDVFYAHIPIHVDSCQVENVSHGILYFVIFTATTHDTATFNTIGAQQM